MAAAADWSYLPGELLELIASFLADWSIDLLRFRSVCRSWRRSSRRASSTHHRPSKPSGLSLPCMRWIGNDPYGFRLHSRRILRLELPENPRRRRVPAAAGFWIVKVEEVAPQKLRLFDPFSTKRLDTAPLLLPRTLDLSDIRVSEVAPREDIVTYVWGRTTPHGSYRVVAFDPYADGAASVVLAPHYSGKLFFWMSGDEEWSVLNDPNMSQYEDVVLFNGWPYAVDKTGRAVTFDFKQSPPAIRPRAGPVSGGSFRKYLVVSNGELLLVGIDIIQLGCPSSDGSSYSRDDVYRFSIWKLDFKGKKWLKLESLGDKMLFLGNRCAFSVLASDSPACKGNSICFSQNVYASSDGSFYRYANRLDYSELFWPPSWVTPETPEPHSSYRIFGAVSGVQVWCPELPLLLQAKLRAAGFERLIMETVPDSECCTFILFLARHFSNATNTIHLPFGEMTITPLDLALIFSLGFGGAPVKFNHTITWKEAASMLGCQRIPCNVGLQMGWLESNFKGIDVGSEDNVLHLTTMTRAFFLYLLGRTILSDGCGTTTIQYLTFLEDIDAIGQYDWGGAALATLYKSTIDFSVKELSYTAGWLVTWEIWALSYFSDRHCGSNSSGADYSMLIALACLDLLVRSGQLSDLTLVHRDLDSLEYNNLRCTWIQQFLKVNPSDLMSSLDLSHSRILYESPQGCYWYLREHVSNQITFGCLYVVPKPPPSSTCFRLQN